MHKMVWGMMACGKPIIAAPDPPPNHGNARFPSEEPGVPGVARAAWGGAEGLPGAAGASGPAGPGAATCVPQSSQGVQCSELSFWLIEAEWLTPPPAFFLNSNKALNQQLAFVFFCFICFHRNSILFLGYLRLLTSQGIVSFFPLIGYEQIH